MSAHDNVRNTEPTLAELDSSWSHWHESARPLWDVGGDIDDARPLVDAIFDDSMNLESLIYREEWRDKLKQERYTIHHEIRPSKDENDFRRVYFEPISIMERLVTISAVNGQASALEILFNYALDHKVNISSILNNIAVDASLEAINLNVFEVICSKYPAIRTFEMRNSNLPLQVAIERSNTPAIMALTKIGAKPGKGDIWSACQLEQSEMLQQILTFGASAEDINEMHALHFAAQDGKLNHIRLLVQYGANLDQANSRQPMPYTRHPPKIGWTPMHFAAEREHVEAMRLLESLGAHTDIAARTNIMDNDEFTPAEVLERKQKGLQVSDAEPMCDGMEKPYFW